MRFDLTKLRKNVETHLDSNELFDVFGGKKHNYILNTPRFVSKNSKKPFCKMLILQNGFERL